MRILFIPLLCLFLFPSPIHAKVTGNEGYCQSAQTLADLVECLGIRLDAEITKMNDVYKTIENHAPGLMDELGALQSEWVAFKDVNCKNQSQHLDTKTKKRIQELTCLSDMTKNRSDYLMIWLQLSGGDTPEYANPPRWVAGLMASDKDAFWKIQNAQYADLDCDHDNDFIVQGLRPHKDSKDYETIIGVANAVKNGKPNIHIITFDDQKNCDVLTDLEIISLPSNKPQDDQNLSESQECKTKAIIKTQSCGSYYLGYDQEQKTFQITQNKNQDQ